MAKIEDIMFQRFSKLYTTVALAFNTGYTQPKLNAQASVSKKSLLNRMTYSYVWRIKAEVDTWRKAIQVAESPIRPDRRALYAIYRDTELNSEVATQTRVASYTVCRAPFQLIQNGKPDEKIKELFERSWFDELLKICVETEFYGHTLVEFDAYKTEANEFRFIFPVPRDHVRPEYGDALLTTSDVCGVDYRNKKEFPFLLEIGRPWDFGLFRIVSLPSIRMNYSDADWSLFSEKFGMPIMAVKTATRDKAELDEKERMAANLGANGYVILDDQDSIEFMSGTNGTSPHGVFLERINKAENQIAKLINGQSSTSDEKAHVGSAEVHERILNNFTFGRLRTIQFFINETLIPFLIFHGYALEGFKFQFTELLEKKKEDNPEDPDTSLNDDVKRKGTQLKPEKKKLSNIIVLPPNNTKQQTTFFDTIKQYYTTDACCNVKHKTYRRSKQSLDLSELIEQVIQDIYTERIKAGDLNIELWKQTASTLIQGMEKGYGKSYLNTAYTDPDKEVLAQLRHNAQVFAAFKNHANIADMVSAMKDENGNIRPFGVFKRMALATAQLYNENWLRTEYDTAFASARMAANWNHTIAEHGQDVLLQYSTVGDTQVRLAHKKLDGTTLPASNPFWATFYPPNGWNCRCDVDPVYDEPTQSPDGEPTDKEVPPQFRFNPGQTNELFSIEHPYYAFVNDAQRMNIINAINEALATELEQKGYFVSQEKFKENFRNIDKFDSIGIDESGGYLFVHKKHDYKALEKELPAATFLKKKGYRVLLLDEQVEGNRPDAIINELIFDIKQMSGATNPRARIVEHFRFTYKKAKRMVLDVAQEADYEIIKTGLIEGFKKYDIEQVILIYQGQAYSLDKNSVITWVLK